MKRSWTALALVLGLILALTACGGNPNTAETPGDATPIGSQTPAAENDLDYVKGNEVLEIGYTLFEPMNYLGKDGELTGLETEFATAVCAKLGVEPKFVEINWDAKLLELENKSTDCIRNDITITPELQKAISISDPYIKNYQMVIIRAADADKYTSTESPAGVNLDVKAGSAGEAAVTADEFLSRANYTSMVKQTDTLLEVKGRAVDTVVMDFVLTNTLADTGDYSGLMVIPGLELSVGEYGIGFRQDSDLTATVNRTIQELTNDGILNKLTVKYKLVDPLLASQQNAPA